MSRKPRIDGRGLDQLRQVTIERGVNKYAEGSALITAGDTRVLCTASVEPGVPAFLRDTGQGWVTAEYSMLPRAGNSRKQRDATRGRVDARSQEIQRLIGRSLRSVVNLRGMSDRTIWLDCDVLQADGGTRCASITGVFVALCEAVKFLVRDRSIWEKVLRDYVAAVSVGIVDGEPCLDLNYFEDSSAYVDMNVVMTGSGQLIEVQGTSEQEPFDRNQMDSMLDLAWKGIEQLLELQKNVLGTM